MTGRAFAPGHSPWQQRRRHLELILCSSPSDRREGGFHNGQELLQRVAAGSPNSAPALLTADFTRSTYFDYLHPIGCFRANFRLDYLWIVNADPLASPHRDHTPSPRARTHRRRISSSDCCPSTHQKAPGGARRPGGVSCGSTFRLWMIGCVHADQIICIYGASTPDEPQATCCSTMAAGDISALHHRAADETYFSLMMTKCC